MTHALGLIEVIGYPPAIEAADAALKAANVQLGGIVKVDGGIMTVQILGDVGAVKSAVDAGGMAAARVGKVITTHVIPRVDESLFGKVIKLKVVQEQLKQDVKQEVQEAQEVKAVQKDGSVQDVDTDKKVELAKEVEVAQEAMTKQVKEPVKEIDEETVSPVGESELPTLEELENMSNKALRTLITSLGIMMTEKKLKASKKEELIKILKDFISHKKGEA